MLIKRFAQFQLRLPVQINRQFRNYPYFDNHFASPPRVPEYFVIYNNMFRKSKTIEIKNSLKETFKQNDTLKNMASDETEQDFKDVLEKVKSFTDEPEKEDKLEEASTANKTKTKKKRNKEKNEQESTLNPK